MVLLLVLVMILACFWISLFCGKNADGWLLQGGAALHWRWPRALAAFSGGAMLALAGTLLQRFTGNSVASPEVLGVSSGAALGIVLLLLIAAAPTRLEQIAAGAAGAMGVLLVVAMLSRLARLSGDRLLLVGVTFSSVSGFATTLLTTSRDPRIGQMLAWLSGSTYAVRPSEALLAAGMLVCAIICLPFVRRWLDLLPLGDDVAKAAGVPIALSRNLLLFLAAVLTASATILVGPLSFAGLIGPHLARLCGFHRAWTHLAASALAGGLLLLVADWIGRNILFPFQIPAGLLATVVGGPFFLILLARRHG